MDKQDFKVGCRVCYRWPGPSGTILEFSENLDEDGNPEMVKVCWDDEVGSSIERSDNLWVLE